MADEISDFMPAVLVFLPSPNEVQRFLLGGAFEPLMRHVRVTFVVPQSDLEKMRPLILEAMPEADLRAVDISPDRMKAWVRLFKAACRRHIGRSRSFALRIDPRYGRGFGGFRLMVQRGAATLDAAGRAAARLALSKSVSDRIRRKRLERLADRVFDSLGAVTGMFDGGAYQRSVAKALTKLGPHPGIAAIVEEVDPLFVMVPTSLLDPFCNDVLWLSETMGFTSVVLQSGWDNLSSKGIILHQPSHVGAWGPQSIGHARMIQKVAGSRVFPVGAPHYEALRVSSPDDRAEFRSGLGIPSDCKLVLFGGSFRQFDESSALRRLDRLISDRKLNVKILYRPHPYRLDRDTEDDFFEQSWANIVFDPEMQERYRKSKQEAGYIKRERPLYSMEYLARMLSAVDAVVSPMSTLLLEALIMDRPTLAVAFSDGSHDYSASTAAQMTHFSTMKRASDALIWCQASDRFEAAFLKLVDTNPADGSVARTALIGSIVTREPGTYADRLEKYCLETVISGAIGTRDKRLQKLTSISHQYGADKVLTDYAQLAGAPRAIPGYLMHGWIPPHFNCHPALVASHKQHDVPAETQVTRLEWERHNAEQWVARADQVRYLSEQGYGKVRAIGLPFAYLPPVDDRRIAGSLLVMPPHGRKVFRAGNVLGEAYADLIESLRSRHSVIAVCVTERDRSRGDWEPLFRRRGIAVVSGSNSRDTDALLRMKRLLSRFETVTTNAFGSHIAYAASCGSKVSIHGPFCEWQPDRTSYAVRMFPELADRLVELQSEETLRHHYPFLFAAPDAAVLAAEWGAMEIGADNRLSPDELRKAFGWNGSAQAARAAAGDGGPSRLVRSLTLSG